MVKTYLLMLAMAMMVSNVAFAEGSTCTAQATEKKLAGAAKTSFMKRCGTDAQTNCDAAATNKKLAGAAKTSFTKKCTSDAVGT